MIKRADCDIINKIKAFLPPIRGEYNMAETAAKTKEKRPRARFYLERSSAWAQTSIIFMLLSAIFRLFGVWGLWENEFFRATQILLPLCCNILFALCVFLFGRRGFFLSVIPVLMGVAFFVIKSFGFDSWIHTVLCILLYLAVAVIYSGTVLGYIRTKWLLPPLFGLPFLYHIFVEDLAKLRDAADPMTLSQGLQELSVLCVMVSLFCVGMGLKKRGGEPKAAPAEKPEPAHAETKADTETPQSSSRDMPPVEDAK